MRIKKASFNKFGLVLLATLSFSTPSQAFFGCFVDPLKNFGAGLTTGTVCGVVAPIAPAVLFYGTKKTLELGADNAEVAVSKLEQNSAAQKAVSSSRGVLLWIIEKLNKGDYKLQDKAAFLKIMLIGGLCPLVLDTGNTFSKKAFGLRDLDQEGYAYRCGRAIGFAGGLGFSLLKIVYGAPAEKSATEQSAPALTSTS